MVREVEQATSNVFSCLWGIINILHTEPESAVRLEVAKSLTAAFASLNKIHDFSPDSVQIQPRLSDFAPKHDRGHKRAVTASTAFPKSTKENRSAVGCRFTRMTPKTNSRPVKGVLPIPAQLNKVQKCERHQWTVIFNAERSERQMLTEQFIDGVDNFALAQASQQGSAASDTASEDGTEQSNLSPVD